MITVFEHLMMIPNMSNQVIEQCHNVAANNNNHMPNIYSRTHTQLKMCELFVCGLYLFLLTRVSMLI